RPSNGRADHRAHEDGSARPLGLESRPRAHSSAAFPREVRRSAGSLGQGGHALPLNGSWDAGKTAGHMNTKRLLALAVVIATTGLLRIAARAQDGTQDADKDALQARPHHPGQAEFKATMAVRPFGIDVVVIEPGAIRTEWGGIALDTLSSRSPAR